MAQTKVKGVADIVFLLDATGSMAPCINAVKDNIASFIDTLTSKDANAQAIVKDWRVKIMGYRDHHYTDHPAIVDNPFTDSVEEVRQCLGRLVAAGGGDEAETLLEALHLLATMPETRPDEPPQPGAWRHYGDARRFVVAFTDAPFKPTMVEPKGGGVNDVDHAITTSRINLYIYAPETFDCFKELAEIDKSEWYPVEVLSGTTPQDALKAFTDDKENFQKILDTLARTITATAAVAPL